MADPPKHLVFRSRMPNFSDFEIYFVIEVIQKMHAEMRALGITIVESTQEGWEGYVQSDTSFDGNYWERAEFWVRRAFHEDGINYRTDTGSAITLIIPRCGYPAVSEMRRNAPADWREGREGALKEKDGQLPPLQITDYRYHGPIFAKPTSEDKWTVFEDLFLVYCQKELAGNWADIEKRFDKEMWKLKIYVGKNSNQSGPARNQANLRDRFDKLQSIRARGMKARSVEKKD